MVVDYCLSCKELTALQSCKNIYSLYKILMDSWWSPHTCHGVNLDFIRSPSGVSGVYQESIRSPSGFVGECNLQSAIRSGVHTRVVPAAWYHTVNNHCLSSTSGRTDRTH